MVAIIPNPGIGLGVDAGIAGSLVVSSGAATTVSKGTTATSFAVACISFTFVSFTSVLLFVRFITLIAPNATPATNRAITHSANVNQYCSFMSDPPCLIGFANMVVEEAKKK